MNIDDVAGRMTHGTPRAAFTARVMAPILGRPRPGFTARVMNRLDEPVVAQAFRPAFRAALILVPAAIALATGVSVLTRGAVRMPSLPGAPVLATNTSTPRMPDAPASSVGGAVRRSVSTQALMPALPEPPPIYRIAALEGPADIAMKSIEPAARTIPALQGPAPLKVPDLPASGGGSQSRESKEKS